MKVKSKGTLIDNDFQINDNEIKVLPGNYKQRPGILNQVGRMLEVISEDAEGKKDSEDELRKEVIEVKQDKPSQKVFGFKPDIYLDQNGITVCKALRDIKFNKEQLDMLKEAEEQDKNRKRVIGFLEKLLKKLGGK